MVGTEISKYRVIGRISGIDIGKHMVRAGMVGLEIPTRPVPGTYLTYGACEETVVKSPSTSRFTS